MGDRSGRVIREAAWRAAGHRLTMVSTGLTAAAGLLMQSATLFGIAAGSWLVSFAINFSRRRVWAEAVESLDLEPIELPHESSIQGIAARQYLARLSCTRAERDNILRELAPSIAPRAKVMRARASELERGALTLIRSLERVAIQLGSAPAGKIRIELERLQRAPAGGLPWLRAEAERARATLEERLAAIEQIDRWRLLVEARLESILAALEGLPARLVRADVWHATLSPLADDAALTALREELETMDAAATAAIEGSRGDRPREGVAARLPPLPHAKSGKIHVLPS